MSENKQINNSDIKSNGKYPLTDSQLGIFLECNEKPDSLFYNIPILIKLPLNTDKDRFINAVKTAVLNHKALFVSVCSVDGVPSMIYKEREVTVEEKNTKDLNAEIKSFVRPFDLENGPLFRLLYLKTPDEDMLLCDIHHIVFDGTSLSVFAKEIADIYNKNEYRTEDLTIFDLAVKSKNPDTEKLKKYNEYFENKLGGTDCDSKPVPDVTEKTDYTDWGVVSVSADNKFNPEQISEYVKNNGISENALFLGAFGYALAKFNGTKESVFTTANHGRNDKRLSNTVGMFVRTLPFICNIDENLSPAEYLKAVYDDYYTVKQNDCVSFAEISAKYGITNNISFVYQTDLFKSVDFSGKHATVEYLKIGYCVSDIEMEMFKTENGYFADCSYMRSDYTEDFAQSLTDMYLTVIAEMISKPTLKSIELTDRKSKELLESFNKTEKQYESEKTVVELFKEQVKKTPDNDCLVFCEKHFTYKQIDEITDRLAKYLCSIGMGKGTVTGVMIPRCEYMLICSLGVLKSGGAYMPLDPTYPAERLNLMMSDSGASMLITTPELNSVITDEYSGKRMMTKDIPDIKDSGTVLPVPHKDDLFVLLYTSGSTGTPKGVKFAHSNTMVTAAWERDFYKLSPESNVTAYASYGFDANVFDTYATITSGATLHIISDDIRLDLPELQKYFEKNKITHSTMTTQVGRQFAEMGGASYLKCLNLGGEKLTPLEPPKNFNLYNLYGPTEGSVLVSWFLVDKFYRDIPIGHALDNVKMYVTDPCGRLLPTGGVGELWFSGAHVTAGYLNRPEKTAEAYGDNPFTNQKGYEKIYRTGDIVRMLSDGNLQFIGRRDGQVKVRGFRVELTEIEEIIRRFEGIKDATVAAFDEPSGGKFVAAYIVSDKEISKEILADFIKQEKPPYMVPAVIMQIDKIPLNQNQKVNKKALPVPERKAENIVTPETETQKKLFEITADILGHKQFGILNDLYDSGLTSIGAIKLNIALADNFDVPVKISDIKANSTIKALEEFLNGAEKGAAYDILPDYPITETQKGIFVESISSPDTTVYNVPVLMRLSGKIDSEKLRKAIIDTINAHPYLKTTLFTDKSGDVRAKRNDLGEVTAEIIKCDKLPEKLLKPFDILGGKLYRIAIYETKDGKFLFMDFHHIICDGTSENIIFEDINKAYTGEKLTAEKFSGFEAALDEENVRSGKVLEEAKAYWDNLLRGADTNCLPKYEPESEEKTAGVYTETGKVDYTVVSDFCRKNDLTLNAFFNAAFSFVLSKYTGKESLTYSTIYNGRNDSRLTRTVSMCVKTLPVLVNINNDYRIADFIREIKDELVADMSHDIYSFGELNGAYGVNSDILFIYQGDDFVFDSLCGEKAELINIASDTAKAPVSVNVYLKDGKFFYNIEYRKDLFSRDFAEAVVDSVEQTAKSFIKCERIKDISLMTEKAEKKYEVLNDNGFDYEKVPCHTLFERQADKKPDSLAVIAAGESMTYGELSKASNILANALISSGINKGDIIGIVLDRTKEVFITEIGIMKAGGAFLPMIPTYPDERIDFCLTNAESPFVITTESIKSQKPDLFSENKPYKTVTVEELLKETKDTLPRIPIDMSDLAYCIYTSGSTGTPKGVMIEHHNFTDFIQTNKLHLNYYEKDGMDGVALASSSISFDMSLYELYIPICSGKCVYISSEEEFHNPLAMKELIEKNKVQMMVCTPSFMNNMVTIPEFVPALKNLKTIVVGAEAFPSALYDTLRSVVPDLQIINGYGPTECTVCCSTKELSSGKGITIGRPTANMKFYVLDKLGHILPPYAVGELIICGEGVGRGYVKLPEKTSAAFFKLKGLSAYKSGDLVRLNGNSEIDFGGRIDNQVKLRGFRVELDEIENVMKNFEGITQSKILVRNNGREDYLAGFFIAEKQINVDELTEYMKSRLTYYMVPAVMMQLEQMPLTPNGKIDKNGFPEVTVSAKKKTGRKAPKKSLEQRLCDIFSSVLGTDEVFADDNFFELGGTSLSASKVTMMLMSENIEVKYGDIFDNPTPESLSEFIERRNISENYKKSEEKEISADITRPTLKYNTVKYAHEVERKPLGNVLLTGAVGFLGIHILNELVNNEEGHIWCLVRKGRYESPEIRLKTMLIYYFSDGFADALKNRITVIDADITDKSLGNTLKDIPFDTVINCAACVKHFSDDDTLERINVKGVQNLIEICMKKGAKLIQISTVSIPGIHTAESYEKQIRMHENELFVIDDMDNKYAISKYNAELKMFDAIDNGLKGKVIRVGNLMGRHSDGEFQVNLETNMFLRGIKGFALMGKYPISHMTDPMRLSPVDCTAKAVVLLAGTNDKFTAFNTDNRYGFDEMKIIDACNHNGIKIIPEKDDVYYEEFRAALGNDKLNGSLNGLAAYDIQGAHAVDTDNMFTANILYRIGFSWPLVDDTYLDKAINSVMTLDYFNLEDEEG